MAVRVYVCVRAQSSSIFSSNLIIHTIILHRPPTKTIPNRYEFSVLTPLRWIKYVTSSYLKLPSLIINFFKSFFKKWKVNSKTISYLKNKVNFSNRIRHRRSKKGEESRAQWVIREKRKRAADHEGCVDHGQFVWPVYARSLSRLIQSRVRMFASGSMAVGVVCITFGIMAALSVIKRHTADDFPMAFNLSPSVPRFTIRRHEALTSLKTFRRFYLPVSIFHDAAQCPMLKRMEQKERV